MRKSILAALATLGFVNTANAGIMFKDIRPKDYPKDRKLDIHVGQLVSTQTTKAYEFYSLDYCASTGIKHHVQEADGSMLEVDAPEYIPGVTMYDQTLHESFFSVSNLVCRLSLTCPAVSTSIEWATTAIWPSRAHAPLQMSKSTSSTI